MKKLAIEFAPKKTRKVMVRLTEGQFEKLSSLTKKFKVNMSDVLRQALRDFKE